MVTGVSALVFLSLILGSNRASLRAVPIHQRRLLRSAWTGNVLAFLAIPLICWLMKTPDPLLIYPLWAVATGSTFYSLGSLAGVSYTIGTSCFILAPIMALAPHWAPLEVGFLMSLNLLVHGLCLRRVKHDGGAVLGNR
jgi:hypothetical protein